MKKTKQIKKKLEEVQEPIEAEEESLNGEGKEEIKQYKFPQSILSILQPDRKTLMLNLHILASRERFLKRIRQQTRNFKASLEGNIEKNNLDSSLFGEVFNIIQGHDDTFEKHIRHIEKNMEIHLEKLPVYTQFLKNIDGLGKSTASAIVSQIADIGRFTSVSGLRKYSGWYVESGRGVSKNTKIHNPTTGKEDPAKYSRKLRQALYHFMDGITKAKDEVYYNDYLKYKEGIYRKHPEYLERKATKGQKIEGIPAHVHKTARRKTIQKFLTDLFCIWRDIEGLPATVPYAVGILGHEGFIDPLKENKHYEQLNG